MVKQLNGINRKVRNATAYVYNGIKFKSKLEVSIYKKLVSYGINPEYELRTFVLSPSMRPSVGFYIRTTKRKFHYDMSPVHAITYTPDFTFFYKDLFVIIEAKGKANDVYPVKRNLFRKNIDSKTRTLFFEIRSAKDVDECLNIIRMETPLLSFIRKNIPYLPEKDISIANRYLENREFDELLELVDSSIKRVRRNKEKYAGIEVAYLHKLKEAIYEYNEARFV